MPLHNVTASSFDHTCVICGAARQGIAHAHQPAIFEHVIIPESQKTILVAVCPNGHREGFNMNLGPEHEIHPDFTDEHRHQAGQIRLLMQHLGLQVK